MTDDRDSIQLRLDALSALERAHALRDTGDYKGARAALAACLQVLPDHPDARLLKEELGEGDDSHETFRVSDWIQEERAREQGDPTDQDDLRHQLRVAIAEQQHEKIISLGEALLTIAGPTTLVYHEQVAASAELLVESNDPEQLDVALGWADTWWRVCHDPRAKDYSRTLKARIATVVHREQRIQDAQTNGNLSELMTAVHDLMSSRDRLQSTPVVLHAAEESLRDLRRNVDAAKQAVEVAIPGRIDEARRLLEEVAAAEPTAAIQARVANLRERERTLSAVHLAIEEALDQGHYTPLAQACYRLRSSPDQLSTSLQLLERAEVTLQRLAKERDANLRAFTGGMAKDLEQAVVALTALRRVDPQHPHCAELPKLERRLRALEDQHTALERRLSDKDLRGVSEALRGITTRSDRLSITPKLVHRAQRYLAAAEQQERRRRYFVYSITAGVLIAFAIPLTWWLIDRHGWHSVLDHADPSARLHAANRFSERPLRLFYDQALTIEQARLVDQLQDSAWNSAVEIRDPADRIAALEGFARDYAQSRHAGKVESAIAAARRSIDERAFRMATEIPDPIERIAALEDFMAQAQTRIFAPLATDAIETAQRQDDELRWQQAAASAEPQVMLERLQAYLAAPGTRSHGAEAQAMIAELERRIATDQTNASEHAAWSRVAAASTPPQRLAAVEAYLATPGHHLYRAEGLPLARQLRSDIDAAAWSVATAATGSLEERIARLQAYLARTSPLPLQATAARSAIADLEREVERERWLAASAPGTTRDRIARLQAYVAGHAAAPYATEARLMLDQLMNQVDHAAYARAHGVLAPGQRVLALQAYLAGDTSLSNAEQARAEVRRALAELAQAPLDELARQPVSVLAQIDPLVLARLPLAVQATLPATALRRLAPEAQAALSFELFAALPPAERVMVPRQPAWCSRSGVDATGAWAEIDLRGRAQMRFRLVLDGTLSVKGSTISTAPLWVAETEITQAQWQAIVGSHPSEIQDPLLPVHRITLKEAQRLVDRLASLLRMKPADPFAPRLPTVVEQRFWAATATAGPSADFPRHALPDAGQLTATTWFASTSKGRIQEAAARQADAWGLHGTFGNVAEWCLDGDAGRAQGGHYAATAVDCAPGVQLPIAENQRDPRVGMRVVFTAR